MSSRLQLDDIRAAVAVERREALKKPRKEDQVGARIHAIRPLNDGSGGHVELMLDRSLPEGIDKMLVAWKDVQAPAELVSARMSDDGAPMIEVSLPTLPAQGIRRVQISPRNDGLFAALDEVLAALEPDKKGVAAQLTQPNAVPTRLALQHVPATDLARGENTWNAHQTRAIDAALTHDLTYVWGPPGTGKTDLLAAVVEGAVRQGHRVLFAAPTKVAVDQALLRIAERLRDYDGFTHGLVQRWGKVELADLGQKHGTFVDREKIRLRLHKELDTQLEMLTAQRDQWAVFANKSVERSRLQEQRASLADDLGRARRRLHVATSSGATRLWKKVVSGDVPAPAEAASITAELEVIETAMARITASLDRLGAETADERGAAEKLSKIDEQRAEVTRALERQDQLLRDTLAVAATTLDGAVQRRTEAEAFDTVVIDEVGMIPLPKAIAVAAMAQARLVMVGDFRQLPAVTSADSDRLDDPRESALYRHWYERDVFDAAGLVSDTGQVFSASKLVSLTTQYRMRPGICQLVNSVAYPDQPLETGRASAPRVASRRLTEPLVLVDTTDASIIASTNSTFNPVHAAVVREILRALQADDVLPPRRSQHAGDALIRDLGVIAPYRAQVRRLVAQVEERFGEAPRGVVSTVHSFQGSERPVMLLDTVAHAGTDRLGPFYSGDALNSTTTRLLNVALSRAQDFLIVVADSKTLRAKTQPMSSTRRMIDHLLANAQVIRADELVPIRSAAELRSLPAEDRSIPAFFTADETPLAVEWDIENACRHVEIFSPFISAATLRQRLRALKAATARGIKVAIWTRSSTVREQAASITALTEGGVVIHERDQMHEKVIVIDDEIVWHGSYNYLAHTRATELMLRMADREAASEAVTTMHRARPTKRASAWPPPRSHSAAMGQSSRVDLNVSYAEKDAVKRLGARWDPTAKKWWVTDDQLSSGKFEQWR